MQCRSGEDVFTWQDETVTEIAQVLYLQGLERGIEANWNSRNRSHVQLRKMVSVLCNEV